MKIPGEPRVMGMEIVIHLPENDEEVAMVGLDLGDQGIVGIMDDDSIILAVDLIRARAELQMAVRLTAKLVKRGWTPDEARQFALDVLTKD